MKMPLIIVEIPHQSPADAWVAYGEEDFILAAYRVKDMEYDLWTMEDARDCFGDPEDIPKGWNQAWIQAMNQPE